VETFQGLKQAAKRIIGIELTPKQLDRFGCYSVELIEWNRRFNLTAITNPDEIAVRHFLDSLTCLLAIQTTRGSRVIDIGTGAGFPGLPLKVVCPSIQLTLVEATRKKVEFCRHVVHSLELDGVQLLHARAEEVGQDSRHRQGYDWALARAVAPLTILVEYLLPLLAIGGHAVAQKGETAPLETTEAQEAIHLLGGRMKRLVPVELPGIVEKRYLVVIEKVAATPSKYPRRAGIPEKRPLVKVKSDAPHFNDNGSESRPE
jgi:16S rRNA (guanine527-N7)-methyltransferase